MNTSTTRGYLVFGNCSKDRVIYNSKKGILDTYPSY